MCQFLGFTHNYIFARDAMHAAFKESQIVHYNEATQRKINMNEMNFDILVNRIEETQHVLQNNARLVVNRHVTAKAWLVGCYIVEYEQKGEDRAKYGERLLQKLAETLHDKKAFSYRSLKLYKQFYCTYRSLAQEISSFILSLPQIRQTASA